MKIITVGAGFPVTDMCESVETFNRQLSARVVRMVSDAKQVDPDELSPLYDVINPDALNALFDSETTSRQTEARVEFSYEGYTVVVTGDGWVDISSGRV